MFEGYYTAASGMLMQQRQLNVISNNLSNIKTTGYKSKELISQTFEDALQTRLEDGKYNPIGTASHIRVLSEVIDIFAISGFTETSVPFNMAISGQGFFNVEARDGEVYLTRNGEFDLDDDGYLVLPGQGRVIGANGGHIYLGTSDILVDENGNIINTITEENMGQVMISLPLEDAVIEQARNGMYTVTAGGVQTPAPAPMVVQGVIEQSNVNMTDELSAMIMAQRNFSSASNALQILDQMYSKATNIAAL